MRTFEQQHTVKKNQLIKLLDAYAYDEIDNIRSMLVNKSITLSAILDQYGLVLLSGVCNAHLHAGIQDICLDNCSGQETNYYRDIAKTKFAAMVTFLAIHMDVMCLINRLYNANHITDDAKIIGMSLLFVFLRDNHDTVLSYLQQLANKAQTNEAFFTTILSSHPPSSSSSRFKR